MVNTKRLTGIFRPLCAAALVAGLLPETALAVSWQWSTVPQGGRERVTITLDAPNQQAVTSRDGTQSLRVALTPAGTTLTAPQTPPQQGALVQGVSLADGALSLSLTAPSFGFIASRPAPNRIVVEIYRDPLGARWKPDGSIAPPPAATAVATPATPATPQTPAPANPAAPATPDTGATPTATPAAPQTPATTQAQTPLVTGTPPPPAALIPQNPVAETATPEPTAQNRPTVTEAPAVAATTEAPAPTPSTTAPTVTSPNATGPLSSTTLAENTPATAPTSAPITPVATAANAGVTDTNAGAEPTAPLTSSPTTPAVTPPATQPSPAAGEETAQSPSAPQNIALPAPIMRGRLNPGGPDAWSDNRLMPVTTANSTTRQPLDTQERTPLRDVPRDNAPTLEPATQTADAAAQNSDTPASPATPTAPVASTAPATPATDVATATPAVPATPATPASPASPATSPATAGVPVTAGAQNPTPQPTTQPTTQASGPVANTQGTMTAASPAVSQNITLNITTPGANSSATVTPDAQGTPATPAATTPSTTAAATATPNATPVPSTPATTPSSTQAPQSPGTSGTTAPLNNGVSTTAPLANGNSSPQTPAAPANTTPPANAPAGQPLVDTPAASPSTAATPASPTTPATNEPAPSVPNTADAPKNDAPQNDTKSDAQAGDAKSDTKKEDEGTATDTKKTDKPEGEAAGKPAEAALQPIYVDEQGNPVPPPPDVPALLASTRAQVNKARYAEALPDLKILKDAALTKEEREEVLYNIMRALFEASHNDLAPKAEEISRAAQEAMNFNLDSPNVPDALNILARVELARGNLADAEGYVMLMKRRYPYNPQVASALLALGEEQMQKQNYADATISFQTILQDYPESKVAKDAARMQTYALYRQGHMQRALTLIDFVQRRWPRIYLEDPEYLTMTADIETRQNRHFDALNTYWTLYNLNPTSPDAATTLHKIAELYYSLNYPESGAKVLDELLRAFPKSEEAPIALLRLAENGVYDGNLALDDILAIFEKPNPRIPGIYYQRIIQEYPDSPQAVTAKLRLIAWQLRNRETLDAMTAARSFMIDYEDKPESMRARDILLRGFAQEMGKALAEENFERVLSLWERFPQVQDYYQPLEPDLRVALARAQLNRGKEKEGMELLSPFLDGPQDPKYGLYVFNLYLAAYLRQQNWDGLLSLGEKVEKWALPKETRDQLDYTLALSAENLGLQSRALPLWQKLAPKTDIPLFQRAYASYFLARDAERRQDLRAAYQYNLDALGMFTQLQDDQSPYADSERIRESIAALMDVTEIAGRFAESLDWANKYAIFVPETSPDYAGLRFREARLHRKMGDMARWRAILQGIIDKEPDSVFGKMAASELHTQDVARDLTRFTGQ